MTAGEPISFGDNVRVRATAVTEARGLAGLVGQVHGETTPSVTGVEVIGQLTSDYAINVHFQERGEGYWFAPDLLDFVDHAAGTEITLSGAGKRWVRRRDGGWSEEPLESARAERRWWRFW